MLATSSRRLIATGIAGAMIGVLSGCMDALEGQTKKTGSIIGKKTQEVQKFDPNAPQQVSDSKVRVDDPILGPMQAYGPIIEQTMKLQIEHAVDLFHASEDRYPKDHQEFMTRIIKENNIQLPVLPGNWKYAYDVENHKLEVVRSTIAPKAGNAAPAGNNAAPPNAAAPKAG